MLAAESPTTSPHLRHSGRKPLHPIKTNLLINHDPPKSTPSSKSHQLPIITLPLNIKFMNGSNKENVVSLIEPIDASLAEELTAVKKKLERLRVDKDKTHKLLQERDRFLEVQMTDLLHRGDFQRELEIEVDRLYRLKHLKQACMRMSPIRSLREKENEKKSKEPQLEQVSTEKSGENEEEIIDESSTSTKESPSLSLESSSSASSTSASVNTKSTASSKMLPLALPLPLRLLST